MRSMTLGDDILDTRDVDARIEELQEAQGELDDARAEFMDAQEYGDPDEDIAHLEEAYHTALANFDQSDEDELNDLELFKSELSGYCDWDHGEALIEEDYRETYAQQLAEDIGAIDRDAAWPLYHIDWEAATNELFANDYTHAEIGGFTYYVRMC